ncbi:MAG: plasmid pRiA4b ORF-3 family protein [Candidatus Cloacimonetes bacterium]|jgi:hypothetical protein|nr:plasmid pRiA4b ORF-3 family protein [Candidatus Cloacimonadota bacterium]
MENELDDSIVLKVIEKFGDNDSIEKTAKECGVSTVKVRKILITSSLWSSPTSDEVGQLYASGCSISRIAQALKMDETAVAAYTPYDRGLYLGDKRSPDAKRSALYRTRIEEARKKQIARKQASNSMKMIHWDSKPFEVHLEFNFEFVNANEERILKEYGKSSTGKSFTRDVLVPGDITLYAFHYVIQRLFGWQNSHLRKFSIPRERFLELTGNNMKGYNSLCGILFRFPDEDFEDQYWNDDYQECESINSWFRRKYTGPYYYGGEGEYYQFQQAAAASFKKFYVKNIEKENDGKPYGKLMIDEDLNCFINTGDMNDLLTRLPLASVLAEQETHLGDASEWIAKIDMSNASFPSVAAVTDVLDYDYDYGDGWSVRITRPNDCSASDRQILQVIQTHRPICLARDGGMLLDDVGGPGGYIDFLDCVYGGNASDSFDYEDQKSTMAWAQGQGWSKRIPSNSNIL